MGSKLYVGNLSYGTTSQVLNTLFAAHGNVTGPASRNYGCWERWVCSRTRSWWTIIRSPER